MENTFFTVIRQFMKGSNETHSMEVFTDRQAALSDQPMWNSSFICESVSGSLVMTP